MNPQPPSTPSDKRRWHGYDWIKLAVAGVLAVLLIRVGLGGPAAQSMVRARSLPVGTDIPVVSSVEMPTAAPTVFSAATSSAKPTALSAGAPSAQPSVALSASLTSPPQKGGQLTIGAPAEGARLASGKMSVSGTGRLGARLEVLNSDQVIAETTVGADGTWSAAVELPAGTAVISVRVKGTDESILPVRVMVGSVQENFCTSLAVGCQVWVARAGGLRLRLRSSSAIRDDNLISRLPISAQMELLEGPNPAGGHAWWRVRTLGGQEGWAAGENLVLQPD